MIEYEDANQILAELNIALDIAMSAGDVTDWTKSALRVAIQKNVYDEYFPQMYDRRGDSGGLTDYENIQVIYHPENKELEIEDIATGNPNFEPTDGRLDYLIEAGQYNYYPADDSLGARPFYDSAEELIESRIGILDAAVEEYLNKILDGSI